MRIIYFAAPEDGESPSAKVAKGSGFLTYFISGIFNFAMGRNLRRSLFRVEPGNFSFSTRSVFNVYIEGCDSLIFAATTEKFQEFREISDIPRANGGKARTWCGVARKIINRLRFYVVRVNDAFMFNMKK